MRTSQYLFAVAAAAILTLPTTGAAQDMRSRAMPQDAVAMPLSAPSGRTRQEPAPTKVRPMTFTVAATDGPETSIYASGDIVEGSAKRLEDLVRDRSIRNAVIHFDSTGGLVVESVRMGQAIRRLGLSTDVSPDRAGRFAGRKAMCASACVYAYAGGVARYMNDENGRLGVHQYYARTDKAPAPDDLKVAQLLSSVIVAHLQEMGISTSLYVAAAMTDSGDMLWLDSAESAAFDLVNEGVLPAKANIRITPEGRPYLVISQIADRGETRFSISCHGGSAKIVGDVTGDTNALGRIRDQAVRSYLEIDGRTAYPEPGGTGVRQEGDALLAERSITHSSLDAIAGADSIGIGVDEMSGQWRRTIDIRPVREEVAYYLGTCRNS